MKRRPDVAQQHVPWPIHIHIYNAQTLLFGTPRTQPPTVVCKMEAQLEHVTSCMHVFFFARLAPICMLIRCLLTKFLHRSSADSLLRVRYWLGSIIAPKWLLSLAWCPFAPPEEKRWIPVLNFSFPPISRKREKKKKIPATSLSLSLFISSSSSFSLHSAKVKTFPANTEWLKKTCVISTQAFFIVCSRILPFYGKKSLSS